MGRKLRIHYPGVRYHVIARGNDRQPIFITEDDRNRFELLVADGVSRFGHRIHAYCWMTNHLHLASQVGEVSISKIMHNLCSRYSKDFNNRYGRSGLLFERRFRAILVRDDDSARRLLRYIHLNPFRAGLTDPFGAYPWSSQRAYLHGDSPPWLETEWMTGLFGSHPFEAHKNLREFVLAGATDLAGDEEVMKRTQSRPESDEIHPSPLLAQPIWQFASIREVVGTVAERLGLEESLLAGRDLSRPIVEARGLAAWIVRECRNQSLSELAGLWYRHPSVLSRGASRIDRRIEREPDLRKLLNSMVSSLADEVSQARSSSIQLRE